MIIAGTLRSLKLSPNVHIIFAIMLLIFLSIKYFIVWKSRKTLLDNAVLASDKQNSFEIFKEVVNLFRLILIVKQRFAAW